MAKVRRVIVESPYKGDVARNMKYARRCVRDCLIRGEAPIASHLLYTQEGILDDNIPEERDQGIEAGHAWMVAANSVVVYMDLGISTGMELAIIMAAKTGVPVEYRHIGEHDDAEAVQSGSKKAP